MKVIFFDLGKTICHPGMNSALKNPRALHDISEALAGSGYRMARWRLAWAFLGEYRRYQREACTTWREQPAEALARRALPALRVKAQDCPGLAAAIVRAYCDSLSQSSRLYPGAAETMAGLKNEGYRLGVVTDGVYGRSYVESLLEALGIRASIDSVTLSSEVGWRKPSPRIFEAACRAMGAEPGRSVFVGDNENADIRGARGIGMRTILFRPRFGICFTRADAVIRAWCELPGVLRSLNAPM